MTVSTKIKTAVLGGLAALALSGCDSPKVLEHKDLTGDGIKDQIVQTVWNRFLMIGKGNDSYMTCKQDGTISGLTVYTCPDKTKYVWSIQDNKFIQGGEYDSK